MEDNKIQYNNSQEPIVLSKVTLDILLKTETPADCLALYAFYYYTAKWQGTSTVKAVTNYVANGLKWSENKVRKIKRTLVSIGLIKDIQKRNARNQIVAHFIMVNFIWTLQNSHPNVPPPGGVTHPVVNRETNALRTNSLNALRTGSLKTTSCDDEKKEQIEPSKLFKIEKITPNLFETFWQLYPKKVDKGKALSKWNELCNKKNGQCPNWKTVRVALRKQKKTERWQNKKYIPLPTTWLNQQRWLDDPAEMKQYKEDKPKTGFVGKEPVKYREPDEIM